MKRKAQSAKTTQKRIEFAGVSLGPLELISLIYCPLLSARLPARFLRALLLRGAVLWLFARIMAIAILASAELSDDGGPLVPLWTLVASSTLLLVDLHRRKELSLLHNLGVATHQAVVIGTLPAVILEAFVLIGRGLFVWLIGK